MVQPACSAQNVVFLKPSLGSFEQLFVSRFSTSAHWSVVVRACGGARLNGPHRTTASPAPTSERTNSILSCTPKRLKPNAKAFSLTRFRSPKEVTDETIHKLSGSSDQRRRQLSFGVLNSKPWLADDITVHPPSRKAVHHGCLYKLCHKSFCSPLLFLLVVFLPRHFLLLETFLPRPDKDQTVSIGNVTLPWCTGTFIPRWQAPRMITRKRVVPITRPRWRKISLQDPKS